MLTLLEAMATGHHERVQVSDRLCLGPHLRVPEVERSPPLLRGRADPHDDLWYLVEGQERTVPHPVGGSTLGVDTH